MVKHAPALRAGLVVAILTLCICTARQAVGETVLVDVDSVYPSGGSGYTGPIPPPTYIEMDVETPDTSFVPPLASSVRMVQADEVTAATPSASFTFDGVFETSPFTGFLRKPPDTHIAVGTGAGAAGRVVEVTNTGIEIWDKLGNVVFSGDTLNSFVTTAGGTVDFGSAFDPKVIFDQNSGRFFVVMLDGQTPSGSNVHIIVSDTSTPSGITTTDWTAFKASAVTSFSAIATWFDYPCIGADSTRLVVSGNMFDGSDVFRGAKIRVFDKAALLTGVNSFTDFNIDAAATTGTSTLQPAHVYGTTDNGKFYLLNRFGSTAYRLWEIGGTAASPTLDAGAGGIHTWAAGLQISAGAPQSGVTGITLDTLSPRAMQAVYRNGSLWCVFSADADGDSKTEVVWFEIRTNGGSPTAPTIQQSGFIDGSDGDEWTFMPSINVNAAGDAMIGYSQSFTDQFADMRAVFRFSLDPLGTFQSSVVLQSSVGEYDDMGADFVERWGDYSATVLDPDDDTTFWVANEYCRVARVAGDDAEWGTRIAKMNVPAVGPLPAAYSATVLITAAILLAAGLVVVLRKRI